MSLRPSLEVIWFKVLWFHGNNIQIWCMYSDGCIFFCFKSQMQKLKTFKTFHIKLLCHSCHENNVSRHRKSGIAVLFLGIYHISIILRDKSITTVKMCVHECSQSIIISQRPGRTLIEMFELQCIHRRKF